MSNDEAKPLPPMPAFYPHPPSDVGQLIQTHPPNIAYIQYDISLEPKYLPQMRALIAKDLSEPYSIYVYRYFLYQWPELCFFAIDTSTDDYALVAVVICKLERHRGGPMRGYIAMLATRNAYRGQGLAKTLVSKAIDLMILKDADEIALETEETNLAAMKLYESLGFLRSKKLHRYYLNGSSAYRLLLYLKPGVASIPLDDFYDPYGCGDLPPSAQDDPRYLHGREDNDDLFSQGII
ncbi:N-alpha-acetyltransferase 30 [Exophiala xenobiotica]|uniref:N-alpha-acetyltransferase 30 n=1 Tax=Lithohypha guttulata TaxID=1690604 RepID=A0ABR0KDM6_9EURO|nr:N-alpha-acetyltransferase 30 [Lithohypha guttulata]KAK5312074.1 N-alpha-acetyltransferase 30 [Exophiala xenobiotica]